MGEKVLILSGRGKLPLLFRELSLKHGYQPVTVGVKTVTDFKTDYTVPFMGFVEFEQLVEKLGNPPIVLLGKFDPRLSTALFDSILQKLRFKLFGGNYKRNWEILNTLRGSIKNTLPGEVIKGFMDYYERKGFRFLPSEEIKKILSPLLADEGLLTPSVKVEKKLLEEGKRFLSYTQKLADMEIGQVLVFKNGSVFAVESVEGTDKTIKRGAKLAGRGFSVAKAARSKQDFRIDIPAVGGQTLKLLKKLGAKALFLESGKVLILEREKFLKEAERAGIAVIGLTLR